MSYTGLLNLLATVTFENILKVGIYYDLPNTESGPNMVLVSKNGRILAWSDDGGMSTTTRCKYQLFGPYPTKLANQSKAFNPPFKACESPFRAVNYTIDAIISPGLKFTKNVTMDIRIELQNDFSGRIFGTIQGLQKKPFYYETFPFNVRQITTLCIRE